MPAETVVVLGSLAVLLLGLACFYWWTKRQIRLAQAQQESALVTAQKDLEATLAKERAALEVWRQREEKILESKAAKMADQKIQLGLQQWKVEEEGKIRADAIMRSAAVSKGKILEHLAAFMSTFAYHPADARFLGSPVDLIVFDGLADGKLEAIRFLEIKTGKSRLTGREEEIRRAIEEKRVSWEQLKVD